MQIAPRKTTTRAPMVQRAAADRALQPAAAVPGGFRAQTAMKVSSPNDPAEREAAATAAHVMRMSVPEGLASPAPARDLFRVPKKEEPDQRVHRRFESPYISRFSLPRARAPHRLEEDKIHRQGAGPAEVPTSVAAEIQAGSAGGAPLPLAVRRFMEPRFRADLGRVRVHTDERAARLNKRLNAHAFAHGQNLFFAEGKFQPGSHEGKELIAHELTHTIQQGAVIQRQEAPAVTQQAPAMVQRFGLSDALSYIADAANAIPGFRMFTIILGMNPINMSRVDRSAANILRALVEFIPGGVLVTKALDNYGIFDKVGNWVQQQVSALGMTVGAIKDALDRFLDSLHWSDIFRLGSVWDRAKRIFTDPIDQLINFAKGLVSGIIQFIKDAILRPIAKLAEGTAGWDLLKAVLGKDPITGDPVPRTAENLVGPILRLIHEDEIWENMKKANALPRVWAWFQGALTGLLGFVSQIPGLFVAALKALQLEDIILLPQAFAKVAGVFGGFLASFVSWAGQTLWTLLEIIFDVVSPGALAYIKKTGAALKSILKNPLPFVGNLVKAAKLGFQNFATNFGAHLKAGLIDWLTGSLPGVYIPKAFTLAEIVKFVFSVLGLSWANIRQKLVKVVGETAVKAMEVGFDIVVTLVTQGPAAAWDKIKEQLANLQDMVIGGITDFVVDMVVQKAVPKLIAMFIPGAGFISAILSIYDTVMVFVNKLAKIAAAVKAFVDSIVAIAGGAIGAAANKVESALAGLLSLAINFLAGFIGLGKVADKVMGVINKVRAVIDKAIDWLINWIVTMAKTVFAKLKAGAQTLLQWWKKSVPFTAGGEPHTLLFEGQNEGAELMVRSEPKTPEDYVKDFCPAGKDSDVRRLSSRIRELKKSLVAAQTKSPPDEKALAKLNDDLTDVFNQLGAALAGLANSSADEGSAKNPIPINYPKRRAGAYPNIYVGPETANEIKQDWLKAAAAASSRAKAKEVLKSKEPKLEKEEGFQDWDGAVKVVSSGGGPNQGLPNGDKVGLDPAFASIAPGKLLIYDEKGSTGGGGKINDKFRPFGFRPSGEGLDGDHVMERQLGGPDELANLWPLNKGENRSSGSTIKSLPVSLKKGPSTVHEARVAHGEPLNLLVKSTV